MAPLLPQASRSHGQLATVISKAKKLGKTPEYSEAMIPTIEFALAVSTAMLAKIWNEAYVLAGSPELKVDDQGRVPIPAWVPIRLYVRDASRLFVYTSI